MSGATCSAAVAATAAGSAARSTRPLPARGLRRVPSVLGRPLTGWLVTSKGLAGAAAQDEGSVLAVGRVRDGRKALPLVRAADISTWLRVRPPSAGSFAVMPTTIATPGGILQGPGNHAWRETTSGHVRKVCAV